jgi:hypothetical protein
MDWHQIEEDSNQAGRTALIFVAQRFCTVVDSSNGLGRTELLLEVSECFSN